MKERALAASSFTGGGFVATLAFMRFDPDDYVRLDTLATNAAHPFQTFSWVEFFLAVTTLGSVAGVIAIAGLIVFFLFRDRVLVARFIIALIGATLSATLVKLFIGRIRPPALPWIGQLHSFSFPSGHATSAMVLFGFIAVVAASRFQKSYERIAAVTVCALLILAIGISRITLAAHYASDVIAGYLLGGFWLSLVFLLPLSPRLLGRRGG